MALSALDIEEIKQLSAKYAHALDFGDADSFRATFGDDAILSVEGETYTGDAIRQYASEWGASWRGHYRHTVAVSPLIDGDKNRARQISYGCFTRDFGAPTGIDQITRSGLVLSGIYEDQLIRIDDQWRFSSRTFSRDGTPEVLRRFGQPLEIAAVDAGPYANELSALDCEAIRQLMTRYGYTLDFSDSDGFVDCFTPDGYFEIRTMGDPDFDGEARIQGAEALREMVGFLGPRVMGHVRHGVLNSVIDGDGRQAIVSSYAFFTTDHGSKPRWTEPDSFMMETTGIYRDEVVKQDGIWRFSGRTFRYDGWPEVTNLVGKPISLDLFRFGTV